MHDNKNFEIETILYEKAVNEINKLKPDFVILTGDLVNNPEDMAQIREFERITAKIDSKIPVFLTYGNHDAVNMSQVSDIGKNVKGSKTGSFSFRHKGTQFIGINSNFIKSEDQNIEQKQYDWLKDELKKSNDTQHIIIFSHYPFFIKSFDERETYSNIGIGNRTKYLNLFSENKVKAVFSGHLHRNAYAKFKEIELVITSSLGKPLGDDPSGLRIIKVYEDKIMHEYYGLDCIPDSINF
jgi:3',5'-cyclic AMP phosphodiesterase CpdA